MPILFCNVGWMDRYDGVDGDPIKGGGSYNQNSTGHEVCNFSVIGSKVYGYVQPTGRMNIEKLGASNGDRYIDGVTVVWTARPKSGGTAVVGWYKNATVYRDSQPIENQTRLQKKNGLDSYRISGNANDATLLPPEQRGLMIPRSVKGGIGQSNVWYADKEESKSLVKKVLELINSGGRTNVLPDVDTVTTALEGNPRMVSHLKRERNSAIVKSKRQEVLARTGALRCEACDFDFAKSYGVHGVEFCEVHHLMPLHKADGVVVTELKDLAIICSNCHRIIHRMNPMPSIQEFAVVVAANRA